MTERWIAGKTSIGTPLNKILTSAPIDYRIMTKKPLSFPIHYAALAMGLLLAASYIASFLYFDHSMVAARKDFLGGHYLQIKAFQDSPLKDALMSKGIETATPPLFHMLGAVICSFVDVTGFRMLNICLAFYLAYLFFYALRVRFPEAGLMPWQQYPLCFFIKPLC